MVQKTRNDQKLSDGPSWAHTAKRLIFPSGPFCQSRSHTSMVCKPLKRNTLMDSSLVIVCHQYNDPSCQSSFLTKWLRAHSRTSPMMSDC